MNAVVSCLQSAGLSGGVGSLTETQKLWEESRFRVAIQEDL